MVLKYIYKYCTSPRLPKERWDAPTSFYNVGEIKYYTVLQLTVEVIINIRL